MPDYGPITEEYRLTYQENVRLATQQKTSSLMPGFVPHTGLSGRAAKMLDLIGETDAREDAPDGGDTPDIGGSHEQTWLSPRRLDWGKLFKKEDDIKAGVSYTSSYVQAGAAAIVRGGEKIRAQAFFGNRKTGQDGTTTTAWDSTGRLVAKTVGSSDGGTNVGMNVKKILRALRLLEDQDVNVEDVPIFCALDPLGLEELYYDLTYVSTDYRSKAVFEEKRVRSILGVTILPTTRIPDYDSSNRRAPLWALGAMHEGEFSPVTTNLQLNPSKQYRPHAYIEKWMGATRGEDKLLVEIRNHKA